MIIALCVICTFCFLVMIGFLIRDTLELNSEILKLKAKNDRYVETLEWYADRDNWKFYSGKDDCKSMIESSDLGYKSYAGLRTYETTSGGRRAREVLKGNK